MSDEAKKTKPGPEPERLVIEDDPGEALDRLLRKESNRVRAGEWIDFATSLNLPPGRYEAVVAVGPARRPYPIPKMHREKTGQWTIQPGGAVESPDTILRVRWMSELPE